MKWLLLKTSFFFLMGSVCAQTLYVHSAKAPVFEQAAFNSTRLLELAKGSEVTAVEIQKRWIQIQVDEQLGWVPALLVNAEPPLNKVNIIGSEAVTLEGAARRRASAVATAGATRGLTNEEAATNLNFDYQELEAMESIAVDQQTIDEFSTLLGSVSQ